MEVFMISNHLQFLLLINNFNVVVITHQGVIKVLQILQVLLHLFQFCLVIFIQVLLINTYYHSKLIMVEYFLHVLEVKQSLQVLLLLFQSFLVIFILVLLINTYYYPKLIMVEYFLHVLEVKQSLQVLLLLFQSFLAIFFFKYHQ